MPSLDCTIPTSTPSGQDFSMRGVCLTNNGSPTSQKLFNSAPFSRDGLFSQFGSSSSLSAMNEYDLSNLSPGFSSSRTSSLNSDPSCLFLYESHASTRRSSSDATHAYDLDQGPIDNTSAPWKNVLGGNAESMQQQGPDSFAQFPDHYFFTRLFRPNAVCSYLLDSRCSL